MLRITRLSLYAAALLFAWALGSSIPLSPSSHTLVLWAPVIALLAYGVFLFLWLVFGVLSFKTVPEEAESLRLDIIRAKQELARRGVIA